jgi:DNA repair protein RecO (recombination protein O)
MSIRKDRAILVARTPGGADGKLLTFLTPESGRVRLYYRLFPRRMKVEFLDALQGGELLYTPPSMTLPGRLHSFHCDETWPRLRTDLQRLAHGVYLADLAAIVASEEEPAGELFDLLTVALAQLDRGGDPQSLRLVYELKLLRLSGFEPSLGECYSCGSTVDFSSASFSPRGGGMVCRSCLKTRRDPARSLSAGALAVLRRALSISMDRGGRLRVGPELKKELLPVMDEIVTLALEGRPLSAAFLRGLEGSWKGTP